MLRYHMSLILQSFFFDQTGCQYPTNGRMVLFNQNESFSDKINLNLYIACVLHVYQLGYL